MASQNAPEGDALDALPAQSPTRSISRRSRWLCWGSLAACALIALLLIAHGARRTWEAQQTQLELETEPQSLRTARASPTATRLSARLAEARLYRDQRAVFELCAVGSLTAPAFRDAFEILILHAEASRLMLRVPLDAAHLSHVQKDAAHSCLELGSGVIEHTGTYRVEAVWPNHPPPAAVVDTGLWVHIQASSQLTRGDLATVFALGSVVLIALLLTLRVLPQLPVASNAVASAGRGPRMGLLLSPVVALALLYLAMQWPTRSGLSTLLKGGLLLTLQLALPALFLLRMDRQERARVMALTRITRPALSALLVLVSVPLLVTSARLALRVVPSTEIAPIQTFIAWPSGMLSAALLGVLLPIGEEVFFRGYLLGVWQRCGQSLAAVASVLVFGLMHLEQSWGNWGGLLAILLTGSVLCALRLATGSTALSAISHVAYNLTLSTSTLAAAIDT